MQPKQPPPLDEDPSMYAPGDDEHSEAKAYDDVISDMRDRTRRLEATLKDFKEKQQSIYAAAIKLGLGQTRIAALHESAQLLAHLRECPGMQDKHWAEVFLAAEMRLRKRAESTHERLSNEITTLRQMVGITDDPEPDNLCSAHSIAQGQ